MNPVEEQNLEKYSSAYTLSDMEIFIFPELLYSLVLANIMSPKLWKWRDHEWFRDLKKMNPHRRVIRLRQFIMDQFEFNLDLDTWGLTTQQKELERFKPFMSEKSISQSNALFGYEGDKYYFDMDIRKHFGLDKYTGNTIPYWKTETLEAMEAFRYKDNFTKGAGECVSLSTLYAAALFVVAEIPLEEIFLMATPLHSQNFISVNEGMITNNRRVVTQNMWFNGSEQSAKAQRALKNEQITIVANNTGYIHSVYPEANIAPNTYEKFKKEMSEFLNTEIDFSILANFLREKSPLQKCFQIEHKHNGKVRYIGAEKVYAYEHSSTCKVNDNREKLLSEIDEDEYYSNPIPNRLMLNKFEEYFKKKKIKIHEKEELEALANALNGLCQDPKTIVQELSHFVHLEAKFPDLHESKTFTQSKTLEIKVGMTREEVISYLKKMRHEHVVADLAFYAFRDMKEVDWKPFIKSSIERSPVVLEANKELNDDEVISYFRKINNESIYDSGRLAQPDEVWNFKRGDGAELAIALACVLKSRHPKEPLKIEISPLKASLHFKNQVIEWTSRKELEKTIHI